MLWECVEAEWKAFKQRWAVLERLVRRESDEDMVSLADELTLFMDDGSGAAVSGRFPRVQEAWTRLYQHVRDGRSSEEVRAAAGEVRRPFEALEGWASILGFKTL